MNSNFELKNHILYEFFAGLPNRENILFETRGVVNGLNKVIRAMCDEIIPQAENTCKTGKSIIHSYSGKVSDMGLSSFFDYYTLEVTTRYSDNKNDYRGGFYPAKSLVDDVEEGVICLPVIELSVGGTNPSEILNTLRFAIGHELTHAYNLLSYARKNKLTVREVMDNYLYGQHYSDIKRIEKNSYGNTYAIANVLYHLNRMERNAYIAQLKQELEAKSDVITDSKSAWQAVLESESYKKFKNLEINISTICGNLSKGTKEELLQATNDVTGKGFKTYKQLKKYYAAYWNTWKKKYLSMAAKIAYDVFEENNVMVDGRPNESPMIKSKN